MRRIKRLFVVLMLAASLLPSTTPMRVWADTGNGSVSPDGCSNYGIAGPVNVVWPDGHVGGTVRLYRDPCSGNIHAYINVTDWNVNNHVCVENNGEASERCNTQYCIAGCSFNSPEVGYIAGSSYALGWIGWDQIGPATGVAGPSIAFRSLQGMGEYESITIACLSMPDATNPCWCSSAS